MAGLVQSIEENVATAPASAATTALLFLHGYNCSLEVRLLSPSQPRGATPLSKLHLSHPFKHLQHSLVLKDTCNRICHKTQGFLH